MPSGFSGTSSGAHAQEGRTRASSRYREGSGGSVPRPMAPEPRPQPDRRDETEHEMQASQLPVPAAGGASDAFPPQGAQPGRTPPQAGDMTIAHRRASPGAQTARVDISCKCVRWEMSVSLGSSPEGWGGGADLYNNDHTLWTPPQIVQGYSKHSGRA